MNTEIIYIKTDKGKGEVANRSNALTMEARRVLIMVNGETLASDIKRKALIEDIDSELEHLESGGYIELIPDEAEQATQDGDPTAVKELMVNTLITFGNHIRVKGLVGQIENATDTKVLSELIPEWYQAISDTPNGMYQADQLKEDLRKMLKGQAE